MVVFLSWSFCSLSEISFFFLRKIYFSFSRNFFFVAKFYSRLFFSARKFSGVFSLGVRFLLVGLGCVSEWVAAGPAVWRPVFLRDFAMSWSSDELTPLKSPCRA